MTMADYLTQILAILSVLSTLGLGIYVQRGSRASTEQANALAIREQNASDLSDLRREMDEMKKTLTAEQSFSRDMWIYCRNLLDLYYRNRKPGSPDPEPLPRDPRVT